MTTLTVGHLHARYVVDDPSTADRLDAGLRRAAAEELDLALRDVTLPSADHVCLPALTVAVRLDPACGPVSIARDWAAQILAALRRAIADGSGTQVYPRTLDAVVDLVVSLGRGDRRRAWAWRQVGLLGDPAQADRPGEAVAAALVAHPTLAPAALVAAATRGPVVLTVAGWVGVAAAVERLLAAPVGVPWADPVAGSPDAECAGPPDDPGRLGPHAPAVAHVLGAPVTRQLPVADLSAPQRRALALLAVVCAAPSLARRRPVIDAVAAALPRRTDRAAGPASGPTRTGVAREPQVDPGPRTAGPPTERHAAPAGRRVRDPGPDAGALVPAVPADPADPAAPTGAERSDVGGALFLLRVVDELGLVDECARPGAPLAARPFAWIATSLAGRLTGAPDDDPVLRVLAGPGGPVSPPADETEQAALAVLAIRVETWLRAALRLAAADDLTPLWRRGAVIVAEPGWIEATFALADVDTAVRLAGLDLDPGFVWWLGAVVRFRYA